MASLTGSSGINKPALLLALFLAFLLISCGRTEKADWPNGNRKHEIPFNIDNKIDGTATWWYEDGTLQQQVEYKGGVINGRSVRWHPNGARQSEETYVNGLLEGMTTEWDVFGNKILEQTYKAGQLDGVSRQWHDNGQLMTEGTYSGGLFDGIWLYWDRFGNLVGQGDFKLGSGTQCSWNAVGLVVYRVTYLDNLKHGKEVWFNNTGGVEKVVIFDHGEVVGEEQIPNH